MKQAFTAAIAEGDEVHEEEIEESDDVNDILKKGIPEQCADASEYHGVGQ